MKISKHILFLSLFIFSVLSCISQTKTIERLKKEISPVAATPENIGTIFLLCDQWYSLNPDTLMAYAEMAKGLALRMKDDHSEVKATYFLSVAFTNKGLLDSALGIADKCLEVLQTKVNDPVLFCQVLNQKGRCYVRKNQYKEAIDMGYKIIERAEKINDYLLQVQAKTLIGWSYLEMGLGNEALNWHLKALRTTSDTVLLGKYAILFANLATNYNGLNKLDSAFYYIKKGIDYSRKYENLFALSNSLAIESELYVRSGHPKFSEPMLKEVVEIRKLIGDPFYTASDLAQLGYYYANYGQPEKGIMVCNEGIELAKKYRLDTKLFFLYGSLAENYKAMGNIAKYAEVLENIIALKDSVYATNSVKALAEIQTKYEVQKKENTIIRQQLDIVSKKYWLYGLMALSVFCLILFYLIFQDYRRKQKIKMQVALAKEKILAMASVKEAEENERRRVAADLHDNLGAYAASIVANLDTISNEQQFNINTINALKELHSNSQSIVSQLGDTIWALKRTALSLTAVSDRIKLVLQKVQPSYPNINMDVVEHIEKDFQLSPVQGFHLFQIIQEAIINALKHSNCTEILVSFISGQSWKILIEDNGTGIITTLSSKGGGNGMPNMINRSKEAGFIIEWQANHPAGTRVVILPTTN